MERTRKGSEAGKRRKKDLGIQLKEREREREVQRMPEGVYVYLHMAADFVPNLECQLKDL